MSVEDLSTERVESLFHEAMLLPSRERLLFLERACAGNTPLREQVLSLISAFDRDKNFLEEPVRFEDAGDLQAQMLEAGKLLGHYRIERLIGRGGMGDVYLALDNVLGRQVALKLLPESISADRSRIGRFWREAKTASALNHPNILTLYEIGEEEGIHYIAAEYVEGRTIRELLSGGSIAAGEVMKIAIQVASGLSAAHARGIVHRDLKPENIMLRPDGYVKILDFGLAKLIEGVEAGRSPNASSQSYSTIPGMLLGTVNYMSPEQARGLSADARSDLFSLGVVIYEMITGACPFSGETPADVLAQILLEQTIPPIPASSSLPAGMVPMVSKLLRKKPAERYQNTEELLADLKRMEKSAFSARSTGQGIALSSAAGKSSQAKSDSLLKNALGSSRWITIGAGALIAAVLVTAFVLAKRPERKLTGSAPAGQQAARLINVRLRVRDLREKSRSGGPMDEQFVDLTAPPAFTKDQQFRLYVGSPEPGYLYLLNEGDTGAPDVPGFVLLFPSPTSNDGSSFLRANTNLVIPNANDEDWFALDAGPGRETIWLVWSNEKVASLEKMKSYVNRSDKGLITSSKDNQEVKRFLGDNYFPGSVQKQGNGMISGQSGRAVLVWPIRLGHK